MRFSVRNLCHSLSEAAEKHVSTQLMFFSRPFLHPNSVNILNVVTTFELSQLTRNAVFIRTSSDASFLFLTLTFSHSDMLLWVDLQSDLILPTLTGGHVDSLFSKHK